jgi:cell division protease FtsH
MMYERPTVDQQCWSVEGPCLPAPTCSQVKSDSSGLPEGNQWRYSEFIEAVQRGKVERVRFAKDGTQLQLTAVDGEL